MNSVGTPENYWIFLPNSKMDGIEAQPYSDCFPRQHIPFSYRLPYLLNNTKMTEKYEKMKSIFPEILPTVFTLRGDALARIERRKLFLKPSLREITMIRTLKLGGVRRHLHRPQSEASP
jgi:hypothetical protein